MAGHTQAVFSLTGEDASSTGARPVSFGASPQVSISIDFVFKEEKGEGFSSNLSPFLSCSVSSLNREGRGVLIPPLLLPLSHYLSFFFLSAECVRASRRFLSEEE